MDKKKSSLRRTTFILITFLILLAGLLCWITEVRYAIRPEIRREDGWYNIDGSYYYFSDGTAQTGWLKEDGSWYYLDPESGAMQTGWLSIGEHQYYLQDDGTLYVNCVAYLDGEWFYFDSAGHLDTSPGWKTVKGADYIVGSDGNLMQSPWTVYYYFLEDGQLACNQWIDRFCLPDSGQRPENDFTDKYWRVDGEWIPYNGTWYFAENDGEYQELDFSTIRSIARLGYDVFSTETPPEQSIASYELALEQGFDILLCDLRFTGDDVAVCFHDASINRIAREPQLSTDDSVLIADHTYEMLCDYDYGLYKGLQYAGTKILTFQEMLEFCERHDVSELYVEIKAGTAAQIAQAVELAGQYDVQTSWAGSTYAQCRAVVDANPTLRVATMPLDITEETVSELVSLRTGENEVFAFAYDTAILDDAALKLLEDTQIPFEMGTIDSEEEIIRYWNGNYHYCTGIESNTVVASEIDLDCFFSDSLPDE